ncbi:2-isopropylmalate synthase [Marinobacter sp. 71-i]|uniref:2-isopropylmalate synthase n=1 Tax=Marinobacter iranensis TaxID=2962607 RepID=A0ABT5YER3_9GAMM|nr:2-isopropylmalate synthase [Marinobacter iranensis]MDF0752176.1 2-isopropylmalate synthase [Marinobacter iranensis]
MMRSEAERQFYLGKAGIHLWYARKPLPGAAPSPEFTFPVEDNPEPEPVVIPPTRGATHPPRQRPEADGIGKDRLAGIQALMAESKAKSPDVPASEERRESPDTVAESVPETEPLVEAEPIEALGSGVGVPGQISAHLGFWVSDRLVLISGVSDQASERLQDVLARNILAAVGEIRIDKWREVRWPVFGNSRVPGNSPDDFRDTLRVLSSDFGSRRVILLGVLVDDLQPERADWLANVFGRASLDFPHTLAELAAVPAHKRELWQQLKSSIGA